MVSDKKRSGPMIDFLVTLAVLVALVVIAISRIGRFDREERSLLWLSLVAHQFAGFANIAVTRYYYTWGDMLSFHRFGVVAADRLRSDFWGLAPGLVRLLMHQPDALPIPLPVETLSGNTAATQAASAFLMYVFFDSLEGTVAFIAGAAFFTKLMLYTIVREELPDLPRRSLIWGCTLLPSALFWSSSLLKEPLAMIGLLCAIYGWYRWSHHQSRGLAGVLIVFGSALVLSIKAYGFPAFVAAAGTWHLARRLNERSGDVTFTIGHFVLIGVGAALVVLGVGALAPEVAMDNIGEQLTGLQTVGQSQLEGSHYELGPAHGSLGGQLALAPLGLLTALFRPLVFEARSLFVLVNSLETGFLTVATVIVLARRGFANILSELVRRPFLSFCAVFVLVFGTFVGLGSTNLGTLSRYRMPLTPFFAILLVSLLSRPQRALDVQGALSTRPQAT